MTNSLSKARKRLFARDPDVRRYTATDTAYDDDEYVPEHTEDEPERVDADRRKVSLILFSFPTPTPHTPFVGALPFPALPFPPIHSPRRRPPMLTSYTSHSVTSPLAFRKEMPPFCAL